MELDSIQFNSFRFDSILGDMQCQSEGIEYFACGNTKGKKLSNCRFATPQAYRMLSIDGDEADDDDNDDGDDNDDKDTLDQ